MIHQLPDEDKILKFYSFSFADLDQPVIIEAYNDTQARALLKDALLKMPPEYGYSKVIGQTVTTPVEGVSTIKINGLQHIWVGKDKAPDGWMEEQQYLESIKK